MNIILEIDDITTDRWRETKEYVYKLKEVHPKLRVTLWVIPALCSYPYVIDEIINEDWIEWGFHGEFHWREEWGNVVKIGGECDKWNYIKTNSFIKRYSLYRFCDNFNHGFKAPWYYIKGDALRCLKDNEFFVAIHRRYTQDIPKGLKIYDYKDYEGSIRLHIQDNCIEKDGIRENFERLKDTFNENTVFEFVSQNVRVA